MRIVFMGTPDFAVPTLETLIQSEHEVVGVVTQPDRPKGRSGKLQFSPVKEAAVEAQIPVFQPERIKDGTFYPVLQELCAYCVQQTAVSFSLERFSSWLMGTAVWPLLSGSF